MCRDFTDLNKWCLRDDFPLLRIDKVVDSVAGCEMMAMLDYFSDYHQIWLHKKDEEKTSFITPFDTYCYLRMPESLNNAGPSFCRMMKAILKDQMYRNVFAYVNDIMVACKKENNTNRWSSCREHAQSPIETQPREMSIRHTKGQSTRVTGISKRDQPRQNQHNSAHEASAIQKRSSEAHRQKCDVELIHVEASRAKLIILHCT